MLACRRSHPKARKRVYAQQRLSLSRDLHRAPPHEGRESWALDEVSWIITLVLLRNGEHCSAWRQPCTLNTKQWEQCLREFVFLLIGTPAGETRRTLVSHTTNIVSGLRCWLHESVLNPRVDGYIPILDTGTQ